MGIRSFNRAERRVLNDPFSKRSRTVQPAHFKAWTAGRAAWNYLRGVKTLRLAEAEELSGMPKAIGALAEKFKNLWALSQADRAEVLATPSVGPRSAAKLEAYLAERNIPLAWGGKR